MASNMILSWNSYTARSLWWSGNKRTKITSTELLRNSSSVASMFASGVSVKAHWKDTPAEYLENATVYAVANLCLSVLTARYLSFWRKREVKVDSCWTMRFLLVCNILMFLCQHLGMALQEGVYSQDKSQIPAYTPPMLSTSTKVAKRGVYMWDTTVYAN